MTEKEPTILHFAFVQKVCLLYKSFKKRLMNRNLYKLKHGFRLQFSKITRFTEQEIIKLEQSFITTEKCPIQAENLLKNPDRKPAEKYSLNRDHKSFLQKLKTVHLYVKCFLH